MRVAVIDIGTNSTRLLVADAEDGRLQERDRRTWVTRLGEGVDATGELGEEPMRRVRSVVAEYLAAIRDHGCEASTAVLTSAVRDASNGRAFAATLRRDYGLDARVLDGDEEARLTYLGATAGQPEGTTPVVVIDIGGGSTEFVTGTGGGVGFHVSTQIGVVRQTERHLKSDPPAPEELQALADEVRVGVGDGIAVAGTATSCAAIAQALDPYDPLRVHGYRLEEGTCELLLARLAALALAERRHVVGLHPDRAPTIVAGVVILLESLRAFGLTAAVVSERDILHGAALALAEGGAPGT